MVICGKVYDDIEFTSETIIRLGLAACPIIDSIVSGKQITLEEGKRIAVAYAALVMRTSPYKAAQRIKAAGAGEIGSVADQLTRIINRSSLIKNKMS